VRAYSSTAEQPAHNWLVTGSNPVGPTDGQLIARSPGLTRMARSLALLCAPEVAEHGFF
jgi:hypothetical protein